MFNKHCLFALGASALAMAAASGANAAASFPTFTFAYTGAEVGFSAAPGEYRITANGAQGGGDFYSSGDSGNAGATISGNLGFTRQMALRIVVGGQGKSGGGSTRDGSGGGGGTFVMTSTYDPLVVAGGGGGAGYGIYGRNGSLSNNGTSTKTSCFGGSGGTSGHSGDNSSNCADEGGGGGGAGIYGQGNSSTYPAGGGQGGSAPGFGGGVGGTFGYGSTGGAGGFGGGGGGGGGMPNCHCNGGADAGRGGGGGGGGYSGGGGGYSDSGGGGGGSFALGVAGHVSTSVLTTGGNGSVVLETLRLYAQPVLASNTLDFGAVRVGASAPVRSLNIGNHAGADCCRFGNAQDLLLLNQVSGPVNFVGNNALLDAGKYADIAYKLSTQTWCMNDCRFAQMTALAPVNCLRRLRVGARGRQSSSTWTRAAYDPRSAT